jgi:hypothetical protein
LQVRVLSPLLGGTTAGDVPAAAASRNADYPLASRREHGATRAQNYTQVMPERRAKYPASGREQSAEDPEGIADVEQRMFRPLSD